MVDKLEEIIRKAIEQKGGSAVVNGKVIEAPKPPCLPTLTPIEQEIKDQSIKVILSYWERYRADGGNPSLNGFGLYIQKGLPWIRHKLKIWPELITMLGFERVEREGRIRLSHRDVKRPPPPTKTLPELEEEERQVEEEERRAEEVRQQIKDDKRRR